MPSAILSINLAILMSRFDSPPQSCVVNVIWTCEGKEAPTYNHRNVQSILFSLLSSNSQIISVCASHAAFSTILFTPVNASTTIS